MIFNCSSVIIGAENDEYHFLLDYSKINLDCYQNIENVTELGYLMTPIKIFVQYREPKEWIKALAPIRKQFKAIINSNLFSVIPNEFFTDPFTHKIHSLKFYDCHSWILQNVTNMANRRALSSLTHLGFVNLYLEPDFFRKQLSTDLLVSLINTNVRSLRIQGIDLSQAGEGIGKLLMAGKISKLVLRKTYMNDETLNKFVDYLGTLHQLDLSDNMFGSDAVENFQGNLGNIKYLDLSNNLNLGLRGI
ncbi:hypothetical protein O9G_004819, partial [Rozella allomycis CSF55]